MGRNEEDSEVSFGEHLKCSEETVSRSMDFEETAGEGSKGSEKYVTGNWRKGKPRYVTAECLATLFPAFM